MQNRSDGAERVGAQKRSGQPTERLLVIGEPPRLTKVVRKLVDLTTDIETEVWKPNIDLGEREGLAGAVLVGPVKRSGIRAAVGRLVESLEPMNVPLFVVAPDGTKDRAVRALYREGAAAVLLWPSEARQLGSLLAESLGATMARGAPDSSDDALVRSVKSHLREEFPLPPKLRVSACRGVVELSGHVDTLPRKQQIVEAVGCVQGVKGTVADGLLVTPSGRSDRAVAKDVKAVLRAVSEVADETLSVAVRNGFVNVAGSVANRREMERLVGVLSNVRGVRGIHNYATVSRKQKANDRALTQRLGRMLDDRFPRECVAASVFGDVAVLSGHVARLAAKRDVEAAVLQHPSIRRVVNKVAVR